jgi:dolichol-phosphate mannosyltransferase
VKRALVTGAAGFVGANLVRRLMADGHEVHVVVHPDSDRWRLDAISGEIAVHIVDLEDVEEVRRTVAAARPDWVFHAAAHGAYPHQTDLRRMVATNLLATVNLLEATLEAGFEAFVHTGTSSEYGLKNHPPAEDDLPEPNSYYAVTKASATLYCGYVARARAAPIRVLRLYSVYGPWEEPTRLMPRLVTLGLCRRWPPMANPATARDYVFTEDVMDAYMAAATVADQEPGAVYNIGTGMQTSLSEVVDIAGRVLGIDHQPVWGSMPDRSWDATVWVADPTLAFKRLGWMARTNLSDGLRSFVDWMVEEPSVRDRYERTGG